MSDDPLGAVPVPFQYDATTDVYHIQGHELQPFLRRADAFAAQLAEVRALLAEMDQEAAGAFPEYEGTGVARYAARLWRIIEPKV